MVYKISTASSSVSQVTQSTAATTCPKSPVSSEIDNLIKECQAKNQSLAQN